MPEDVESVAQRLALQLRIPLNEALAIARRYAGTNRIYVTNAVPEGLGPLSVGTVPPNGPTVQPPGPLPPPGAPYTPPLNPEGPVFTPNGPMTGSQPGDQPDRMDFAGEAQPNTLSPEDQAALDALLPTMQNTLYQVVDTTGLQGPGSPGKAIIVLWTGRVINCPFAIGGKSGYFVVSPVGAPLQGSMGVATPAGSPGLATDVGVANLYAKNTTVANIANLQFDGSGNLKVTVAASGTDTNVNIDKVGGVVISSSLPTDIGVANTYAKDSSLANLRNMVLDGSGNLKINISAQGLAQVATDIGAANTYAKDATLTAGAMLTKIWDGTNTGSFTASGALKININGQALAQVVTDIGAANTYAKDATLTGGSMKTKVVDSGGTNLLAVDASGRVTVNYGSGTFVTDIGNANTYAKDSSLANLRNMVLDGSNFLKVNIAAQALSPISVSQAAGSAIEILDSGGTNKLAVDASGRVTVNYGSGTFVTDIGNSNTYAKDTTLTSGNAKVKPLATVVEDDANSTLAPTSLGPALAETAEATGGVTLALGQQVVYNLTGGLGTLTTAADTLDYIAIKGATTGRYYAICFLAQSVSGFFFVSSAEKLNIVVRVQDTAAHVFGGHWQAMSP